MKYCPRCKQRAKEDDANCPRCGGPLRVLGGPPPAADASPSASGSPSAAESTGDDHLHLHLAGLQHQVTQSAARARILAVVAGVLSLFLIGLLVYLRHSYIMQFATVRQVQIVPSEERPGSVEIRYVPTSAGKVECTRETPERLETLIDHAVPNGTEAGEQQFFWSGQASDTYSIRVRYRKGWGLATEEHSRG